MGKWIIIGLLFSSSALANGAAVCSFESGDIGKIEVQATTKSEARSIASNQCFERRMNLLEQRGNADYDQGYDIIDSCVNICP